MMKSLPLIFRLRLEHLFGYTGLLEFKSIPEGQTTCHIEVFAGDDAVPFVQNLKKDGEKKPTMFQVSAGAILRIREKKYPNPAALVKVTLKANTAVTVIEQDTASDWIHVREKELIRSVKREWLEYHDDKAVEGDEHYSLTRMISTTNEGDILYRASNPQCFAFPVAGQQELTAGNPLKE